MWFPLTALISGIISRGVARTCSASGPISISFSDSFIIKLGLLVTGLLVTGTATGAGLGACVGGLFLRGILLSQSVINEVIGH